MEIDRDIILQWFDNRKILAEFRNESARNWFKGHAGTRQIRFVLTEIGTTPREHEDYGIYRQVHYKERKVQGEVQWKEYNPDKEDHSSVFTDQTPRSARRYGYYGLKGFCNQCRFYPCFWEQYRKFLIPFIPMLLEIRKIMQSRSCPHESWHINLCDFWKSRLTRLVREKANK